MSCHSKRPGQIQNDVDAIIFSFNLCAPDILRQALKMSLSQFIRLQHNDCAEVVQTLLLYSSASTRCGARLQPYPDIYHNAAPKSPARDLIMVNDID